MKKQMLQFNANQKAFVLKVPASQTSYSATELKAGRYDFWVTASTIIGEGQPSATASCSPSDKGTLSLKDWNQLLVHRKKLTNGQQTSTSETILSSFSFRRQFYCKVILVYFSRVFFKFSIINCLIYIFYLIFIIFISVPAKIASFDESFTATYKEDVKLPCLAVGVPPPNILWKVFNTFKHTFPKP